MSDSTAGQTTLTRQEKIAALLTVQIALQSARRDQLDVGELFSVDVVGANTVSEGLMKAIADHVAIHGVRLNYVVGIRCHFIVHAK